jgi:hypothetical protein
VQIDPVKPKLKPPGTIRLKLVCDVLLSNFAFKFNFRRYTMVRDDKAAESREQPAPLVSVRPEDSLHLVSLTLMQGRLAMAPVLSYGATQPPRGAPASQNTEGDERVDVGEGGGGSGGGGGGGRTPAGPGRC